MYSQDVSVSALIDKFMFNPVYSKIWSWMRIEIIPNFDRIRGVHCSAIHYWAAPSSLYLLVEALTGIFCSIR